MLHNLIIAWLYRGVLAMLPRKCGEGKYEYLFIAPVFEEESWFIERGGKDVLAVSNFDNRGYEAVF